MARTPIHTLDLNFQGQPQAIASYMLEHSDGVVLVETGPGSTLGALEAALKTYGYGFQNITHVLLTHIHLDHAGAAGYLASQGAQIYVHPMGAPHLLNPEKLIASATRIYGDLMETLWGEFLPVPAEKLTILQDNDEVLVGGLRFTGARIRPAMPSITMPICSKTLCFTGDVGAVRIPGYHYLRLPMPPPELNLEKWRETVARLQKAGFKTDCAHPFWRFRRCGLASQVDPGDAGRSGRSGSTRTCPPTRRWMNLSGASWPGWKSRPAPRA